MCYDEIEYFKILWDLKNKFKFDLFIEMKFYL